MFLIISLYLSFSPFLIHCGLIVIFRPPRIFVFSWGLWPAVIILTLTRSTFSNSFIFWQFRGLKQNRNYDLITTSTIKMQTNTETNRQKKKYHTTKITFATGHLYNTHVKIKLYPFVWSQWSLEHEGENGYAWYIFCHFFKGGQFLQLPVCFHIPLTEPPVEKGPIFKG